MEDVTLLFTLGANPLNISLSYILGLLAGEDPTYNCCFWSFRTQRTLMEQMTLFFTRGVISINKCPPFVTLRGCWRGKDPPKVVGIGTSILREPRGKILHCF